MAETVDILFEYKESRRQLSVVPNDICQLIRHELSTLGLKEGMVIELRGQSSNSTQNCQVYLLQKWSPRFACHTVVQKYYQ